MYVRALGEAFQTRHRWPLGDEGKQAKLQRGGSGPPPLPHIFLVAAIDVDAFFGRKGIGNYGLVGEGDKASHPHTEFGLHGDMVLLSGEAR